MKSKDIFKQGKRFEEASRKLDEALKHIQPYSTPRKMGWISTDGKWITKSSAVGLYMQDDCKIKSDSKTE